MRHLATVQTITKLEVHPNADKLEIAHVKGWSCVVIKGSFTEGEKVVFIEPDAVLPEGRPEWEFMRERGFRIKTIKLRKVLSQGLVFNAHSLLADKYLPLCEQLGTSSLPDETDVTDLLGITKYEPYVPANLSGTVKGNFPEFLHKTDETRIQAVPELLYKHQNKKFYLTEKVDGSSMTVYFRRSEHTEDGEFGVCSRNLDLKETEGNAFWKTARELDLESKLRSFHLNVALQGELVGPGVQGNKYKLEKLTFFVFNVFNIGTGLNVNYADFKHITSFLGLTTVPVLSEDYILPNTVEELIEFSKGKSTLNKETHREGIVLRPLTEEYDSDLRGRLSFKAINPDFLLRYNE